MQKTVAAYPVAMWIFVAQILMDLSVAVIQEITVFSRTFYITKISMLLVRISAHNFGEREAQLIGTPNGSPSCRYIFWPSHLACKS